jgi:hypothetical protein
MLIIWILGWYPEYVRKFNLEENWKDGRCLISAVNCQSSPLIFRYDPNLRQYFSHLYFTPYFKHVVSIELGFRVRVKVKGMELEFGGHPSNLYLTLTRTLT